MAGARRLRYISAMSHAPGPDFLSKLAAIVGDKHVVAGEADMAAFLK